MPNSVLSIIEQNKIAQSEILDLSGLGLVEIPEEVFDLKHLKKLSLTNNKLVKIQEDVKNLKELEIFGLNYNQLEYLPIEVGELKKLKSLDLWNNKLKSLPIELNKLNSLEYLTLGFNKLNSIPRELYLFFSKLKALDLQSNPFEELPIIKNLDLLDLMTYFKSESAYFGVFEVPKQLQTVFQQYILFFSEYANKITGEDLQIEVAKVNSGLKVTMYDNGTLDTYKMNSLFSEYMGYLRMNTFNKGDSVEKEFLALQVEQQKNHFQQQLKFLEFENKYLQKTIDKLLDVQLVLGEKPVIQISIDNNFEKNLVAELKEEIQFLKAGNSELVLAEINKIEEILNQNRPNKGLMKNSFKVIYDLLIEVTGSGISPIILETLKNII